MRRVVRTYSAGKSAAAPSVTSLSDRIHWLEGALEASMHGILLTDMAGKVLYCNHIFLSMFDLPDQSVPEGDTTWKEVAARRMKDPARLISFVEQVLREPALETLDTLERADGCMLECHTRYQQVGPAGQGIRMWGFADRTEQYRRERELQRLGMHDPLTGIYNRNFFDTRLRQLRQAHDYPVCMFMADVDGLKRVNDDHGHPAGDQLLRHAANLLHQACRADDIVARLGGDEFGMLLTRTGAEAAELVADRILGLLNIFNIRHPEEPMSLSLGYALANQPAEMDSLFARADATMYESRRARRSLRG